MKQSLVELVDVILRHIQDHPEGVPTETGIRSWLRRQGYAKRDIEAAIKLVRPRFAGPSRPTEQSPGPVRHFSTYEQYKLTPEARDALVRLDLYSVIDPYEREMVLERLDQFEGEVGLEELNYLLSWVVCGNRDVESQQTLYNLVDGKGETLH